MENSPSGRPTLAPLVAGSSPTDRPPKSPLKSRVANGSALLSGTDGRSLWVRRCREILEAHLSDLGGEANASEAEKSIARRAAVITVQLEQLEVKFADGTATEHMLETYQRCTNTLRRTLETLGIKRRPRTVESTESLEEYCARISQEPDPAELEADDDVLPDQTIEDTTDGFNTKGATEGS
jgi:hypothetical protein